MLSDDCKMESPSALRIIPRSSKHGQWANLWFSCMAGDAWHTPSWRRGKMRHSGQALGSERAETRRTHLRGMAFFQLSVGPGGWADKVACVQAAEKFRDRRVVGSPKSSRVPPSYEDDEPRSHNLLPLSPFPLRPNGWECLPPRRSGTKFSFNARGGGTPMGANKNKRRCES